MIATCSDACADRLWQVADGGVKPFDGDMDDYKAMVLGTEKPKSKAERAEKAAAEKALAVPPRAPVPCQSRSASRRLKTESRNSRISSTGSTRALADRDAFVAQPQKAAQLGKQRNDLAKALALAEEDWLMLSAEQDAAQ